MKKSSPIKKHRQKQVLFANKTAIVAGLIVPVLFASIHHASALSTNKSVRYVEQTAVRSIRVLADKKISKTARRQKFQKIVITSFDVPAVARYVTGSAWRKSTKQQKIRFTSIFRLALAQIYTARFFKYDAGSLRTRGTKPMKNGFTLVRSVVSTPTKNGHYNVDWLVRDKAGKQRFIDVIIDGISTNKTTKQDYFSVLHANKGNLDMLTDRLLVMVKRHKK